MITLAFDTAMGAGSVVVAQDSKALAKSVEPNHRALAERLVPMVEETLSLAGHSYKSIDQLAVTVGPGTFTGMRIGLAAARSMAQAANKPLVGVSTLEVIAQQVAGKCQNEETISVCFDARRSEVYLQTFQRRGTELDAVSAPLLCSPEQASEHLAPYSGVVAGSGAGLLLGLPGITKLDDFDAIDALALATIAEGRPRPEGLPEPLYLRDPDAKLPGGKTLEPS